jgi:hypothetical protein
VDIEDVVHIKKKEEVILKKEDILLMWVTKEVNW